MPDDALKAGTHATQALVTREGKVAEIAAAERTIDDVRDVDGADEFVRVDEMDHESVVRWSSEPADVARERFRVHRRGDPRPVKCTAAARCSDECHLIGGLNGANGNAATHGRTFRPTRAPRHAARCPVGPGAGSDVDRATVVCRRTSARPRSPRSWRTACGPVVSAKRPTRRLPRGGRRPRTVRRRSRRKVRRIFSDFAASVCCFSAPLPSSV
jgi:hypothetical protein